MTTITRRPLLASLAFGWIATATGHAHAAERAGFTDQAFEAAQAAGRSIILDVTAPWCPICRAQKPHLDAALADPRLAGALLLEVDFDSQKSALQRFGVRQQSTLIAFKGRQERGRATGITDGAAIRDLLLKAI